MMTVLGRCLLLLAGLGVSLADPDFYSAWCPCRTQRECPNHYGRFFDDIVIFGQVPPCKEYGFVRCCSANNIPEGFSLEEPVQYLPQRVKPRRKAARRPVQQPVEQEVQRAIEQAFQAELQQEAAGRVQLQREVVQQALPGREARRRGRPAVQISAAASAPVRSSAVLLSAPAPVLSGVSGRGTASRRRGLNKLTSLPDAQIVKASLRQDVLDYKSAQEKLKRDIASGIDNPNPPCGCYTAGECPGRYATKSTGRDIGCLPGFETCCFLDDPWPNYQVTNMTIMAPCSTPLTCEEFYGTSPFHISMFGALEPCYLGQNRCLDFLLEEGSGPRPSIVRPPVTRPPTTRRPTRPPTTRRVTTTSTTTERPAFTARPTTQRTPQPQRTTQPTYRPTPTPFQPTFRPTPTTFRPTYRPTPTTSQPTYRPTPTPFRPPQPEPQPSGSSSSIIDIVNNGAYLPPSRDFGDADERAATAGLSFQLPF